MGGWCVWVGGWVWGWMGFFGGLWVGWFDGLGGVGVRVVWVWLGGGLGWGVNN